jgi:hypothetical protein
MDIVEETSTAAINQSATSPLLLSKLSGSIL